MFRRLIIIAFAVLFIILMPSAFAITNDTAELTQIEDVDIVQGSADYYFNSSVETDGDGSYGNPHRNLENNINAHSVNYLANGEYTLGKNVYIGEVSFIGEDADKTVIDCQGEVLNVTRSLTLKNVTLVDFTIINRGTLDAENTIFSDGFAYAQDSYGNSYGGAIYTPYDYSKVFKVTLDNCKFVNNYAQYGGAIYMDGGQLNIVNSEFINNTAYNYGGSIACEYNTQVSINKTKFINSRSVDDAGGAIYLKESDFSANKLDIINSTSTFGGAIAALNSNVTLYKLNFNNNAARYDGGAIFQIYGKLSIQQSVFNHNSARNGGALFLDNLTQNIVASNRFSENTASDYGGAIFSISNPKITFKNIFENNGASLNNDIYETESVNIFEIGKGNYTIFINDNNWDGVIPSKFDLRSINAVSSIKNQQYGGNCWSFASLAALESCILKATGKELDLSEENMKNLAELYSDYGWNLDTNNGGYNNMAIGYLTGWLGPVNEIDDVYDDYSTLSPMLNSIMHVQNVLFLKRDNYTDNDAIKKAIMKYGAVATGICYYPEYLRGDSYYCYKIFDYANHAVTIVGWDDNYSKDNFWGNPEIDGAWIVKNSWGESWGDDGFFYVSYCDKKLAQVGVGESSYTFILNDTMRYDRNYQYDVIGKTNYFSNNDNEIYYQNVFKSAGDEILAAVSTHFEKTCGWDLSVYVNDVLQLNQSGISDAGYYTIKLNELIPLKLGDAFKVIFKISGNGSFRVPISEKSYTNKFMSKEGLSFFSYDGNNWFDLFTSSAPSVASIKAFTLTNKIATILSVTVEENQLNPVEIFVKVTDEYGNSVKSGNLTFLVGNESYSLAINDSIAKFVHNFTREGLINLTVLYNGIVYNDSSSSVSFNTNISQAKLLADDLICYYQKSIGYIVKLTDSANNALDFKNVTFIIDGVRYDNVTSADGFALINAVLTIGEHDVFLSYAGDNKYISSSNSSKIIVKSTLNAPENQIFTFSADYAVGLLDTNGSKLNNTAVEYFINSNGYSSYSTADGQLIIKISMKPGTYSIKINNPLTGQSIEKAIKVISRISQNKDLTMYFGAKKVFKVRVFDDNGKAIKNAKVKFTIGKNVYYKVSDKNGYASLTVSLKSGKYTVKSEYKGFEVSNKIVIKKTLITKNKSVKKAKTVQFTAKLLNSNGKILKSKKITFKIKGKKYVVKTNKKGIAVLKLKNLKVGKYTVITTYGKLKESNKLVVRK